jgi:hypothetical protein
MLIFRYPNVIDLINIVDFFLVTVFLVSNNYNLYYNFASYAVCMSARILMPHQTAVVLCVHTTVKNRNSD